jgi:hypothetical protein
VFELRGLGEPLLWPVLVTETPPSVAAPSADQGRCLGLCRSELGLRVSREGAATVAFWWDIR